MFVFVRQVFFPTFELFWIVFSIQALLTGALTFLAQAYHYSAFYYGRKHGLGSLDPIGVGIPTRVHLAVDENMIAPLKALGVHIGSGGVTDELYLIDETNQHYIISFHSEAESREDTLKVDKTAIKAILYSPDHVRPLAGDRKNTKRK